MMPRSKLLGNVEFSGKDIPTQPAKYDRLAVDRSNKILLISVVAESQYVKAIRAILNGGVRCQIDASGGKIVVPDSPYATPTNPGKLTPTTESYECHTQKLDFGLVHAMFVTRMPGFMPVLTEDRLWLELRDDRFTTPMLRSWLPYIRRRLEEMDLLNLAESFNFPYEVRGEDGQVTQEVMRCGVLEARTQHLDAIVTEGLRTEHIAIPQGSGSRVDPAGQPAIPQMRAIECRTS